MKRKILIFLIVLKWFVVIPVLLAVVAQTLTYGLVTGQFRLTVFVPDGAWWSLGGWLCGSSALSFGVFVAIARYSTVLSERADAAVQAGDLDCAGKSLLRHRRLNAFLVWLPFYRPIDPSIPEQLAELCITHRLYARAIELYESLPATPLPAVHWEWQMVRWHNYAFALAHAGRETEAAAWVEKEEALVAAHPEAADKRLLPLVTRGFLARAANDLAALECLTDELTRSDIPPPLEGIRTVGHLLRSDFEMMRGNQVEALKHTRLYLALCQDTVRPNEDRQRMQDRERELATAAQTIRQGPEGEWDREPQAKPVRRYRRKLLSDRD